MSGPSDHWLDRVALACTRREALKAALAGAALTLPFAWPAAARAADPKVCRKGCNYTTHVRFQRQWAECGATADRNSAQSVLMMLFNPTAAVGLIAATAAHVFACTESATLHQKLMAYDCLQPNCGGFDPTGPDGPCVQCAPAGFHCCPRPNDATGYGCCSECCSKDGNGCDFGSACGH